jgi:hypothetical protein
MLSWHSYRGHRRASEKGWPARSAPSSVQPTVSRCVCACLEDVSVRVRVLGRDVRSGDGPLVPFSLVSCLVQVHHSRVRVVVRSICESHHCSLYAPPARLIHSECDRNKYCRIGAALLSVGQRRGPGEAPGALCNIFF